jgi:hypothetical protein
MNKIRIGIVGYGNIARGVEAAVSLSSDMELAAVFTRRQPDTIKTQTDVKVLSVDEVEKYKDIIDVMVLCLGSATDLPVQTAEYAKMFNTVDSFDNHKKIPEYLKKVDESALSSGKISIISIGWDPGLFSIMRMLSEAVLPEGSSHTFWGRGVSQGHSDAIRRIPFVKQAKSVIDAEAGNILADYIDRYYYDSSLSNEEFFSKAFTDAADRIMTVTRSPWITVFIVLGVVVLVIVLFIWWKKHKEQKNLEAKRREEMLNTPLERFGTTEAEDLMKKYQDDNEQ